MQYDSAYDDGTPVESWTCNFECSHQSVRFYSFAVFTRLPPYSEFCRVSAVRLTLSLASPAGISIGRG